MRLLTLAVALICALPAKADGPFDALDFDAAAAKAKAKNKLLLVDFMATWCPPCKQMETVTWPDEAVGKWIGEHAVAIQVDVDKQPEFGQKFSIEDVPTVVFLYDGTELDRCMGSRDPDEILAYCDAVLAASGTKDTLLQRGRAMLESDQPHVRTIVARELLQAGEYDLALKHDLWLWTQLGGAVRQPSLLADMGQLAGLHEPARKAFQEILDHLQHAIDTASVPEFKDWQDWSAMCQALGEATRVVTWYESRRDKDGRLFVGAADDPTTGFMTDSVFRALLDAGRPMDAVRLYGDVVDHSRAEVADYKVWVDYASTTSGDSSGGLLEFTAAKHRHKLATLHAAALAAGLSEQAAQVARDLLGILDDASSRVELVERTLDLAPTQTAGLAAWLDEAENLGADVTRLRARLAKVATTPAVPAQPSGG